MKIVIDIPEEDYRQIKEYYEKNDTVEATYSYIYHGTPLPKGHGRLIDADAIALIDEQFYVPSDYYVAESAINNAPTIIEARRILLDIADQMPSDECADWIDAISLGIKALEQTRWIPVSERLPEERNHYLITVKIDGMNGCKPYYEIQTSWYSDKQFVVEYIGDGLVARRSVIAWMPLPQPYRESEE